MLRLWIGIVVSVSLLVAMGQIERAFAHLNSFGEIERGIFLALILGTPTFVAWLLTRFIRQQSLERQTPFPWAIRTLRHRKMTIAVGILLGALSGGLLAYFITRQPNEIVLTQLPPYARMIRDSVMTLAHEIEVVSDKQFKNEIVLMDGEQLGPDRDPQSIFALTPNAGFCFVESLKPIPAAFAAVEQTLYRDGQMGRMVTSGYEEVAVEYHSLLGMRWVLNAHKYRDGVDLSGGQRFHICLYGLRKVDPLVMNRLRNALDKAEAKLMATPIRLSR